MPEAPRVVAFSETRLSAIMARVEDGRMLSVYRSALVKTHSDLYAPIRALLEEHCTKEVSSVQVSDRNMMFGRAVRSRVMVYDQCPGGPHECAALPVPSARTGTEVMSGGDRVAAG